MEISWQQHCFSIMLSFRRLTQTTKKSTSCTSEKYLCIHVKTQAHARKHIDTHAHIQKIHTVRFNEDHADTPIQQPGPAFLSFSASTCVVQSEVYYTSILNYA